MLRNTMARTLKGKLIALVAGMPLAVAVVVLVRPHLPFSAHHGHHWAQGHSYRIEDVDGTWKITGMSWGWIS